MRTNLALRKLVFIHDSPSSLVPSLRTRPVIRVPPLTLAPWPPEGAANHCGRPANGSGPSLGAKPLMLAGVPDMRWGLAVEERDNTASQRQLTHIGQGSHRMDESVSICHSFDWEWSSRKLTVVLRAAIVFLLSRLNSHLKVPILVLELPAWRDSPSLPSVFSHLHTHEYRCSHKLPPFISRLCPVSNFLGTVAKKRTLMATVYPQPTFSCVMCGWSTNVWKCGRISMQYAAELTGRMSIVRIETRRRRGGRYDEVELSWRAD